MHACRRQLLFDLGVQRQRHTAASVSRSGEKQVDVPVRPETHKAGNATPDIGDQYAQIAEALLPTPQVRRLRRPSSELIGAVCTARQLMHAIGKHPDDRFEIGGPSSTNEHRFHRVWAAIGKSGASRRFALAPIAILAEDMGGLGGNMKRIAVINQKGGVGKTTTTVNLGAGLAHLGRRVLLLDLDPQANMTVHVDKRPDLESNTLTNLLLEDTPLGELVQSTSLPNLSVVPSDTSLAGVEQVLANRIGRETILREALEAFGDQDSYDFVLFDCPPSLGVLSANALVAADFVVIPMQAEYLSLQGMAKLLEVIQLVQKRLNPSLQIACVLPCMLDSRTNLSGEVLGEIEAHFGDLLTKTRIRNNVKLAEAPSFGRTIFEHAPDSNGARDYQAFSAEFLAMIGEPLPASTQPSPDAPETEATSAGAEQDEADQPTASAAVNGVSSPAPIAAASEPPAAPPAAAPPAAMPPPIVERQLPPRSTENPSNNAAAHDDDSPPAATEASA